MSHQTDRYLNNEISQLKDSNNILKILVVIAAIIALVVGYSFGTKNESISTELSEKRSAVTEHEDRIDELETENSDLKDSMLNISNAASDGLFAADNGEFDEMVSTLEDIEQESSK
jgi:cell division protein FtsL